MSDGVMWQRPQVLTDQISKLLREGTVADLCSEHGRFLRQCMTAGEEAASRGLPMPECPDFNGVTCAYCRENTRFINCQVCHGHYDPTVLGWPQESSCASLKQELEQAVSINRASGEARRKSMCPTFWERMSAGISAFRDAFSEGT